MKIIDNQLVFNGNHSDRDGDPKGIVLHHAGGDGGVEDIHRYHKNVNGWAGIGYHFYIRKDGTVYRGRPEQWLGAHTSGHNDMIGICAEGNFEKETMNFRQQQALSSLLAMLFERYGDLSVYRHRELDTTACPGKNYPFGEIADTAKGTKETGNQEKKERYSMTLRYLSQGDSGEDVRALQILLIGRGYPCGTAGADGIFGGGTATAVRACQGDARLVQDGVAGPATMSALLGV